MKQNLVSLSINVSRAYEISRAGNHSMSIVFDATEDTAKSLEDNCILLREFYAVSADKKADIVIELNNIESQDILSSYQARCETIEDINQRIEDCKKSNIAPILELKGGILSILKSAIDKLSLSIRQVNSIISVSYTIAKLSKSKDVKIEHIAEAIQYQSSSK
jgi:hypothetical protein